MKKILLLILCSLLGFNSFSQNCHLDFKGIPINGNLEDIVKELVKIGYTTTENKRILTGKFIGEECIVAITESEYTGDVNAISIFINEKESWFSLKSNYFDIKELYNKKYGEGKSVEKFDPPYEDGDGYEVLAIKRDKCHYLSRWTLSNGYIIMSIRYVNSANCIIISYYDKINTDKHEQIKSQSFMEEI